MKYNTQGFYGCCGAVIAFCGNNPVSLSRLRDTIKWAKQEGYGQVLIILRKGQGGVAVMKEFGFVCGPAFGGRTGATLTTWTLNLRQPRKRNTKKITEQPRAFAA